MNKISKNDYEILFELIKNCKRSDRELAKVIGISQPTITRSRTKIEKERLISDYTAMPNLEKIGVEIIAFTFFTVKPEDRRPKDLAGKFEDWKKDSDDFYAKHSNIIFASTGRGLGKNSIWISLHKNYASYVIFLRDVELRWGKYLEKTDSFIVSVESDRLRRLFTLRYLPEYLKENTPSTRVR
jgi:DNA-binding Lrp family transcriptional regulator